MSGAKPVHSNPGIVTEPNWKQTILGWFRRKAWTEPERPDWKKIIEELEANGLSIYKISLMLGLQYTQVKRWKLGREPKYYEGAMLLALLNDVRASSERALSSRCQGSPNPSQP